MNLDDLREAQVSERQADSLRSLPDSFYEDVAAYLADLRERREAAAERADDPFGSEEVRRLTDEIETAEEVAEAIYDRRVGKLVKRASLAAAGMPADDEGLTAEEADLFDDLVDQIQSHREDVLDALSGEASTGGEPPEEPESAPEASSEPPAEPPPEQEPAVEAEPPGPRADPAPPEDPDPEPTSDDADRVTLRITQDVGEVFGVDERTYELSAEDVVTLPTANAEPLLERDAAQRL